MPLNLPPLPHVVHAGETRDKDDEVGNADVHHQTFIARLQGIYHYLARRNERHTHVYF